MEINARKPRRGREPKTGFGRRLRALREVLGLTQLDFAVRYDISYGAVRAYEETATMPRSRNDARVAALLRGVKE